MDDLKNPKQEEITTVLNENDFEVQTDNIDQVVEVQEALKPVVPELGDAGWSDYVLSQLTVKEKDKKGNPRIAGLRRLTLKLVGPVIDSYPEVIQTPCPDNERRSTVVYHLAVQTDIGVIKVAGAGDAYAGNCDKAFSQFPSSMAETRAEGRAYKKLLLLDAVTAEELCPNEVLSENTVEEYSAETIKPFQMATIKNLAKRNNINVAKLITHYLKKSYNLSAISEGDGAMLIERISEYQNSEKALPEDLTGFEESLE